MRRPRRVVIVWAVLAVLVGAIVVTEQTDLVRSRSSRARDADARMLLPVPVDRLGAIEVANAGTLHRFERDAAGAWLYHGPHAGSDASHTHTADPAAAPRIAHALAGFGRTRIERHVGRAKDPAVYGVATPRVVILLYRPKETQPFVQYAVGDVAPDTASRYVDVVGGTGVVTIPSFQIDNLLALIDTVAAGRPDGVSAGTSRTLPGAARADAPAAR